MKFKIDVKNMKLNTKLLLYILSSSLAIFALVLGFIAFSSNRIAINDAKKISESKAKEYADIYVNELNNALNQAKALHSTLESMKQQNIADRITVNSILKNILIENNEFQAVWTCWEPNAFDSKDSLYINQSGHDQTGRYIPYWYRGTNGLELQALKDYDKPGLGDYYLNTLSSGKESISEPFSFTDKNKKYLLCSISFPIIQDNKTIGVVGIDINLEKIQLINSETKIFESGYSFVVSNNGLIIAHPLTEYIEKNISEIFPESTKKYKILENLKTNSDFTLENILLDNDSISSFYTFSPCKLVSNDNPWYVILAVPTSELLNDANSNFLSIIISGIFGILLVAFVIIIVIKKISKPIIKTNEALKQLSIGIIDQSKKINVESNDEIGEMALSLNTLIDGLKQTAEFSKQIGDGNLNADFKPLSDDDILGNSLLHMRTSLQKAEIEEEQRKSEDEKRNWAARGLAKFSEILRKNNDNLHMLSFDIIENLVQYLKINQGGLFIYNDDNENNKYLELTACYAYDRQKFLTRQVIPGEGLVGSCFIEKQTIYLTEVPNDYIKITSGLGSESPNSLLIVPLKLNDNIYGVIELASFKQFQKYEIEFVEKIGESIASTISTVKINIRTAYLLEQSQVTAQHMKSQEEEMRQNMEELTATQESLAEKEKIQRIEIESLQKETRKVIEEIRQKEEQSMAVLESCLDSVITINDRGTIQFFNTAAEKFWGYPRHEVIGRNVSILVPDEIAYNHDSFINRYIETGVKRMIGKGREVEIKRKDGSRSPAYISITETKINSIPVFTAFIKDLTEQKKNIQKLLEKDRLQKIEIERLQSEHEEQLHQFQNLEKELKRNIDEMAAAQEIMKHTYIEGNERAKEISTYRDIQHIIQKETDIDKGIRAIIDYLKHPWLNSDIAVVRITLDSKSYEDINFQETQWKLAESFTTIDDKNGSVEVFYLIENSFNDEEKLILKNFTYLIKNYLNTIIGKQKIDEISEKLKGYKEHEEESRKNFEKLYKTQEETQNKNILLQSFQIAVDSILYRIVMSTEGNLDFINEKLLSKLGYTNESLKNESLFTILTDISTNEYNKLIEDIKNGYSIDRELVFKSKNNTKFNVKALITSVKDNLYFEVRVYMLAIELSNVQNFTNNPDNLKKNTITEEKLAETNNETSINSNKSLDNNDIIDVIEDKKTNTTTHHEIHEDPNKIFESDINDKQKEWMKHLDSSETKFKKSKKGKTK